VLLAQALFYNPEILLLDEPTNHLDMNTIDWLCGVLKQHKGTVIVISHNRFFINEVCTNIADLDYQEIRLFNGNYDFFMTASAMAIELQLKDNKKKEKRIEDLKCFINRFSANASKAKQATSRQKELDKIQLNDIRASSRVSPYIRFTAGQRLGEKVIEAEKIEKVYDHTLFKNISFSCTNNEKVAILGTNGAGKTTLIKILMKLIEPCNGEVVHGETVKISYFPQDTSDMLNTEEGQLIPARRWTHRNGTASFMGKMLFSGDDVYKP
jgi:ATPase subunit of ABC transporter with duplicated ATPase domains